MNRLEGLTITGTRVENTISRRTRGGALTANRGLDTLLHPGSYTWVLVAVVVVPFYLVMLLAAGALVKYLLS